jgi:hypothetical protein
MQIGPQIWNADNSPNAALRCNLLISSCCSLLILVQASSTCTSTV